MNGMVCNDDSAACDVMRLFCFVTYSDNDYDNLVWSLLEYNTTLNILFISLNIFYNINSVPVKRS